MHIKTHLDPQFICATCGKAYKSKKQLKIHDRSHTGEMQMQFKCDECGKFLKTNATFKVDK